MARGLPLFIRDHFKLDPAVFYSFDSLTDTLNGNCNFSERKYLSSEEDIERDRLDEMEDEVSAEVEIFISKD